MGTRYLIIGAGIAGSTAAEAIRERDKEGEITLISGEPELVYSRILLTKFFKGKLAREKLFLKTSESLGAKGITVKAGVWAKSIDTSAKTAALDNGDVLSFDKLLIATGGQPKKWAVPGADKKGVFHFQTLADTEAMAQYAKSAKVAAVVGGGFVSLDLIDVLLHYKIETHLFLRQSYYWSQLMDEEQGLRLVKKLESLGVIVHSNQTIVEVKGNESVSAVKTNTGLEVAVDMVGYGIGLERNIEFLAGSGIKTNQGVVVNEYLESSVPGIFAAGDAAEFFDATIGKTHVLGNWDNALGQGKIAGLNMAGERAPYQELTSYSMSIGGLIVATVGNTTVSDSDEIIVRKNETGCIKILLSQNRVIGAAFVGGIRDLVGIKKLIAENMKLNGKEKEQLRNSQTVIPSP